MDSAYYREKLYPLQDHVLAAIMRLDAGFYLTGGTALSRHYLNHRYSDDLDLFANQHQDFKSAVRSIEEELIKQGFDFRALTRSADFVRLELDGSDGTRLILDLVNDLVCRFGELETSSVLGKVDNVLNILSNKLAAITRLESKDFADVVCIARNYRFNWEKLVNQAGEKDVWVTPLDLAQYLYQVEAERFSLIRWIQPQDLDRMAGDCRRIADDILHGADNSLCG